MFNLPNWLTIFRIFLVPFLVVVLLTKMPAREFIGLAIFLMAIITDGLDGYFARKWGQTTRLGALLDPIADKFLMTGAFVSLVELDLVPAWMVVIIVGREFLLDGLRMTAMDQGLVIPASRLGKLKTFSQTVAVCACIIQFRLDELSRPLIRTIFGHSVDLFEALAASFLWIAVILSLGSMADYFVKFSKVLKGAR
jgi:CDP-diacylglycerol--glycerol-3-phosphate 3-phosphatidyltransferase